MSADRTGAPFSVRISTRSGSHTAGGGVTALMCLEEGPSCLYVSPVETASKETLEALYRQARDAYYRREPSIIDDMFDRVELKLRWYGPESIVKYPRCRLWQQSTYADAEFRVLPGPRRNGLAAPRGACPNYGEEVFAFVR